MYPLSQSRVQCRSADAQYAPLFSSAGTHMLDLQDIECPYCGEVISLALDASAGAQRYIEDCQVCCRPITVVLEVDTDGAGHAHVLAQDDA